MTYDEIMALEAGRELDALVAEKVMGWKWDKGNSLQHLLLGPDGAIGAVIFHDGIADDDGIVQPLDCPHYSTDIAAAWEVVEKLRRANDGEYLFTINDAGMWYAKFLDEHGEPVSRSGFCDTAPLAICRAGLLAVMEA